MRAKPARWAVNPAMVGQNWKWAWNGLELLVVPDRTDKLRNMVTGQYLPKRSTSWPSTIEITEVGEALRTYGGSDATLGEQGYYWEQFDTVKSYHMDSGSNWTIAFVWRRPPGVDTADDMSLISGIANGGVNEGSVILSDSTHWHLTVVSFDSSPNRVYLVDVDLETHEVTSSTFTTALSKHWLRLDRGSGAYTEVTLWAVDESINHGEGGIGTRQPSQDRGGAEFAAVYSWSKLKGSGSNTDKTVEFARRLAVDPFGPIRPAGTLILPIEIAAANTLTLYATADGTISSVVNELDTTTNLWQSVDDDPDSPNDSDWINNTTTPASTFLDLGATPADFGSMDTLTITTRLGVSGYASNVSLYAQIFQSDESTTLSDEMLVDTATADGSFATLSEITFTGLNTTASKTIWDNAKVRFRWA